MIPVKIIKRIFIRKGPGKSFASIGDTSPSGKVINMEGKVSGESISGVSDWYFLTNTNGEKQYYWGGGLSEIGFLPANLPANCTIGVDVSHHNGSPDWNSIVAAGATFVYIKTSEGVGTPDRKANEFAQAAKQKGLQVGYYHFCRPDTKNGGTVTSDATAEANEVLRIMGDLPAADLPMVLDLEDQQNWDTPLGKLDYLTWVVTFINQIINSGKPTPIIYSRKEYLDRKLPPNHNLGTVPLWISYYGKQDCNAVACPVGWTSWLMWQFTEKGQLGGNLKIDLNIRR